MTSSANYDTMYRMSVIYRPTGMAREYSPYALNLYIGCSHRCKYCYAPHTLPKSGKAYFGTPEPRKNILALLESDLKKTAYTEQILLSFVGDVYCESADGERRRARRSLFSTPITRPWRCFRRAGNGCCAISTSFVPSGSASLSERR